MLWMAQGYGWHQQLQVVGSGLWAQGSKCYELLKVVANKNDFGSWAKGSKCYEQLKAKDDMNDSKFWA